MFILLLLVLPRVLPYSNTQKPLSTNTSLLAKTLEQFQHYDIALHYENAQLEQLRDLLSHISKHCRPVYLRNYDGGNQKYVPLLHQLLHVVFLKDTYKLEKYAFIDYLNVHAVVIIVSEMQLNKNKRREMCRRKNLSRARMVVIYEMTNERFSICCYYCGKYDVTLRALQREKGLVPDLHALLNKYKDFGGRTLKIGYEVYSPFFYNKFKNNRQVFYGPEFSLLNAGGKWLNYKYTLIHYTGNKTNGVKDIMVDEVSLGKIDTTIGGVSQTLMRTKAKNIEFTRYIQFQSYMVVYEINEDNKSFAGRSVKFWYISNWYSLMLTVVGVVGIASVIKLSLKCSRKFSYSFGEYAIITMLYLIEQQSTKLKRNIKHWRSHIKLLFTFWLFTSTYLLANYKSVQAYFLMTSQTVPNNIDDLMKKGYEFQIESSDFANIKLHCQYLTSEFCSTVLKKLEIFEDDVCASIRDVLNFKVALIREEEPLKFTALKECNLTIREKQNLKFVPAAIIPKEWHAWPFRKSTPFVGAFSRLMSRIESTGLLRHWYTREIKVYNNFYSNVVTEWQREHRPLNMCNFSYPFILLLVGYVVSLLAYLKETVTGYKFKSNIGLDDAQ